MRITPMYLRLILTIYPNKYFFQKKHKYLMFIIIIWTLMRPFHKPPPSYVSS